MRSTEPSYRRQVAVNRVPFVDAVTCGVLAAWPASETRTGVLQLDTPSGLVVAWIRL
jgi:hypothetical protein